MINSITDTMIVETLTRTRVLVTSVPKSGTNMLHSTLEQFPALHERQSLGLNRSLRRHPFSLASPFFRQHCEMGVASPVRVPLAAAKHSLGRLKPGEFAIGHIPFDQGLLDAVLKLGIRPILVIRDPRDVLISSAHHTDTRPDHFLSGTMAGLNSDRARFSFLIKGGETLDGTRQLGLAQQIESVLGWYHSPNCLTVRFEDLVGPNGGGSEELQIATIQGIGRFLGVELPSNEARQIGAAMFGQGRTFRAGTIAAWQNRFDGETHKLFMSKVAAAAAELGYVYDD